MATPGLYGVPIQLDRATLTTNDRDELGRCLTGLPILLDRPMFVVAIYVEPGGSTDKHNASEPVIFPVTGGSGFARIDGPAGDTRRVPAGEAVLWPAGADHKVWAVDGFVTVDDERDNPPLPVLTDAARRGPTSQKGWIADSRLMRMRPR